MMRLLLCLAVHFISIFLQVDGSLQTGQTEKSSDESVDIVAKTLAHHLTEPSSSLVDQFNKLAISKDNEVAVDGLFKLEYYSPANYFRQDDPILKFLENPDENLSEQWINENKIILAFGLVASWYRTDLNFRATLKLLENFPGWLQVAIKDPHLQINQRRVGRFLGDIFEKLTEDAKSTLAREIIVDVFQVTGENFDKIYLTNRWGRFTKYYEFLLNLYSAFARNMFDHKHEVREPRKELIILDHHPRNFFRREGKDPAVKYFKRFFNPKMQSILTMEEMEKESQVLACGLAAMAWDVDTDKFNTVLDLLRLGENWTKHVVEYFNEFNGPISGAMLNQDHAYDILNIIFKDLSGDKRQELVKVLVNERKPSQLINETIENLVLGDQSWRDYDDYHQFIAHCEASYRSKRLEYARSLEVVGVAFEPARVYVREI